MKTAGLWIPIALSAAAIFATSQSSQVIGLFPWIPGETKEMVGHLGLYFVLGLLLARYFFRMGVGGVTVLVLTANVTAVLGIYDEFHQSFVGDRSVQLYDIVMDLAGGIAGGVMYLLWAAVRWLIVKSARSRERRLDLLVSHAAVALTVFVFVLLPAAVCSVFISEYAHALATEGPAAAQRVLDRFLQPNRAPVTPIGPAVDIRAAGPITAGNALQQAASTEALSQFARVAEFLSQPRKEGSDSQVSPVSAPHGMERGGQPPGAEGLGSLR